MEIIPAVDIKGGRCVRLRQGRMDEETIFGADPLAMALRWQDQGVSRLHVVDLDGAVQGQLINAGIIEKICDQLTIPVQLGGGVRDLASLATILNLGVQRVILGTLAVRNPELALQAARTYPGQVVIGIDARDGQVAIEGWTETSSLNFLDLAHRFDVPEVAAIVFTDINRDGMHSGVNLDSTALLCASLTRPLIIAGGLHDLEDIKRLKALNPGPAGAITGRAIYEGTLDLAEALKLVQA